MKSQRLIQTASLLVALTAIANAQWTVTSLNPPGSTGSGVNSVSGNYQYGWANINGKNNASRWSGTAASRVSLHPDGAVSSYITGSDGVASVGNASYDAVGNMVSAILWPQSATDWINLNPPVGSRGYSSGVSNGTQVGFVLIGNNNFASIWSGSAESWINLNPTGAFESLAWGVSGNQQVGQASFPGTGYASLWTGTAESWVNLNPIGAQSSSAYASSGTSQVGSMQYFPGNDRAALWQGSATSFVDLHLPQFYGSNAYGVAGQYQVGRVMTINGVLMASLWKGSASSWINLHSMLPARFTDSSATSVSVDSTKVVVGGYGSVPNGGSEALLWTFPIRKISGNMILENTTGQGESGTEAINWILGCGSNTYTGVVNVSQLGGGAYSIEIPLGTPNGAYTLQFKGGTFLSSSYVLNLNGNNITRTIRLRNGDIDQDGEVGPGDFEAVVGQFGGPGNADADNDGEVGPSDFEIVVGNFGLQDQ
jgi:hypothetical protein